MWKAALFVNYSLKDRRSKCRFLNILESAPQQAVTRAGWCEHGIISPGKSTQEGRWTRRDSNPGPLACQASTLPAELRALTNPCKLAQL